MRKSVKNEPLLRIRDLRAELGRILGIEVTRFVYRHWQRLGFVPPPQANHDLGRRKYRRFIRHDEVALMVSQIERHRKGKDSMGRILYRRPGVWRASELMREIARRTKLPMKATDFRICFKLGIIPPPDLVLDDIYDKGETLMKGGWSDSALEEAIGMVLSHIEVIDDDAPQE